MSERITVDQVIEQARHWPREQVAKLVDSLTLALHNDSAAENEASWQQETRRRLAELESGNVQSIAGDSVSQQVRKIVGR